MEVEAEEEVTGRGAKGSCRPWGRTAEEGSGEGEDGGGNC